jgi:hypothetical protein
VSVASTSGRNPTSLGDTVILWLSANSSTGREMSSCARSLSTCLASSRVLPPSLSDPAWTPERTLPIVTTASAVYDASRSATRATNVHPRLVGRMRRLPIFKVWGLRCPRAWVFKLTQATIGSA